MPLNLTTHPAGATALADLANDGLLGGAPVESADELAELYGCPRCSLFNGAHKPNCPDRDEAVANRDYAREAAADRDYDELMVTWAGDNAVSGRIGGDATPWIVPEPESGGPVVLTVKNNVTARFRKMPDRYSDYPCLTPNWIIGTDYTGESYDVPKPCEKCINCVAYALERKIVRWDNGSGLLQTVINVTGAANADEARKWTGALSKAIGKLPDRATLVTEYGEILIVFADALEVDSDLITRIWKFANAEHGNAKRPSKTWPGGRPAMQCLFGQNAVVNGVDLAQFVGSKRTAQGERTHISWRLHGDAFSLPPREDDFAFGPSRPLPKTESPPAQPEVSDAVVKSRTRWRKVIAPRTRQTMLQGERAAQAMAWCAGVNLITYTGPPKLLKQYAAFKAGKRDYEPAWDYVADLCGDDPPTPWRQPRDCKGCGFPYYPTPGRRQCANCEGVSNGDET